MRLGVRERIDRLGGQAGPNRGVESARKVMGRLPVVRELGGVEPSAADSALVFQGPGERGVEPRALAGSSSS